MTSELIKQFAPWLYIAVWIIFALRVHSFYLIGAGLFLASFAGFSQNFSFVYRELHQFIQIIMMAVFIIGLIRRHSLNKFNYVFLGVLFFVSNSIMFSAFDEDARAQTINLLVMIVMTNFLYHSIRQNGDLYQLFGLYAKLSILAAVIGVTEYIFTPSARIEATMANPNYYAYFLGIGFCVAYDRYYGAARLIIPLLIIIAIVLSGSRAALAFPVIHLLMFFIQSHVNWRKKILPLMAFSLVASSVFLSGSSRFSSEGLDSSDAERSIFLRLAFEMANDHPLTGIGWGRFPSEFSNYASGVEQVIIESGDVIDVSTHDRRVTHNDFVRILAELGFPAAVGGLLLCFFALRKAYFIGRNNNIHLFSSLAGTLLFSLTHNNLNSVLFWFFLLLPFMLESIHRRQLGNCSDR